MMHKTREKAESFLKYLNTFGYDGEIVRWTHNMIDRTLIRYQVKRNDILKAEKFIKEADLRMDEYKKENGDTDD